MKKLNKLGTTAAIEPLQVCFLVLEPSALA
jgi:hypothetical protein